MISSVHVPGQRHTPNKQDLHTMTYESLETGIFLTILITNSACNIRHCQEEIYFTNIFNISKVIVLFVFPIKIGALKSNRTG